MVHDRGKRIVIPSRGRKAQLSPIIENCAAESKKAFPLGVQDYPESGFRACQY